MASKINFEKNSVWKTVLLDTHSENGSEIHIRTFLPVEKQLFISINQNQIIKLSCSPHQIEELGTGHLINSRLINHPDEILSIAHTENNLDFQLSQNISSELNKDTLQTSVNRIKPDINKHVIFQNIQLFLDQIAVVQIARGLHASAIFQEGKIIAIAFDIGRKNTLDRLAGQLFEHIENDTEWTLLTTSRINQEMIDKRIFQRCGIVCSLSSPTSNALEYAKNSNSAMFGFVKNGQFSEFQYED